MTTQKISELVDGELEGHEAAGAYSALQSGGEAREAWRRYHLISDAIHDTRLLSAGFAERVSARLAGEPTVVAPAIKTAPRRFPQYAAIAAGVAAVAFVGAVVVNMQGQSPVSDLAKAPTQPAPAVAVAEPTEAARDYMLAHQGYSPRNALQGYVRTVSAKAPKKP